jgi:hypothetical protein
MIFSLLLVSIRSIIHESNPNVKQLGYKITKKVKNMKNVIKISILAGLLASYAAVADATSLKKSLTDYLNDQNTSFLIVHSIDGGRLTTFGLESAAAVCKNIKSAGYSIETVRNYSADARIQTAVNCK